MTTFPVQSSRIRATASSSISRRTSAEGHTVPSTCSFSASPLPMPRMNLPSSITALVAAAWAITTGLIRIVGQVTAVVTGREHAWESAPITDHTNGL